MNQSPNFGYPNPDQPAPPQSYPPQPRQIAVKIPSVRPVVTYVLLGVTVAIYLLQELSGYTLGYDLPANLGMKVNNLIQQGQLWRLITPVFLHGSPLHIAFNMYALYAFGPGLERFFGHLRFTLLYFLAGFAGVVASFLFSPYNSLGSSTAIFGLIAAEGIFFYRNRKLFAGRAQSAIRQIVTIAAINLIIGATVQGIDNWGHIGGLLGGAIFSWLATPQLKVEGIPPDLQVVDEREGREVFIATVFTASLFGLLAAYGIYFK